MLIPERLEREQNAIKIMMSDPQNPAELILVQGVAGAVKLEGTLHLTSHPTRYASLLEGDNWQTGTSGTAESLSDRATLERRTQDFEQHILDALKLNTTCQHLFQVKRFGMLLKMMEWPGFRAVPQSTVNLLRTIASSPRTAGSAPTRAT